MRNKILMLMALAIAGISCTETHSGSGLQSTASGKFIGSADRDNAEEGILLVKVTKAAADSLAKGTFALSSVLSSVEGAEAEPVFPAAAADDAVAAKHSLNRWYTVRFDGEVSADAVAEILADCPQIAAIQYNTLHDNTTSSKTVEYVPALTRSLSPELPFNDPNLSVQWNIINRGDKSISETAVEGADVCVKDAWRLTAGDPRIIVAVMDQGISVSHPDLAGSLWVNTAEYNGTDGADDDNNGYKDDKHGYNFVENKGKPSAKYNADHGTHIAGTIAAVNNNGIGVSSIAGGSGNGDGVRLMSCQIFNERGKTSSANVAKAFHYAARHGASIVQCSYGESDKDFRSDSEYSAENTVEHDALMYFLDPQNANCAAIETNIAVFASGNYNSPASLYPGALAGCVSVTAIGPDMLPGGYSNYGAGCDIAAPGGDIVEGDSNAPCMILSTGYGSSGELTYVYKYGTSMACPHVSGVVALGMSYALKLGKRFTREDFISRLLVSTTDIDSAIPQSAMKLFVENGKYVSVDVAAKKGKMGAGAVNAWKFLMAIEGTPTVLAKTGEETSIDIAEYIGETAGNFDYTVSIDYESRASLGIEGTPVVSDGAIRLTCTKSGAGKVKLSSSVGESGQISGLDFFREISIVSRTRTASNGGWF